MYAILKIGKSQYKVKKNQIITVDLLGKNPGETVEFTKINAVIDGDKQFFGTPEVAGAKVTAEVLALGKTKRIRVFKKKRKKHYERTKGHRQDFAKLKIKEISIKQ